MLYVLPYSPHAFLLSGAIDDDRRIDIRVLLTPFWWLLDGVDFFFYT